MITCAADVTEAIHTSFKRHGTEDCPGADPTETPGVFYHGSPDVNIRSFESQRDLQKGASLRTGIFFTQIPTYAAMYALARGDGFGGRIYRAGLVTRDAFFADPVQWSAAITDGTFSEAAAAEQQRFCSEITSEGFDSIVSLAWDGGIAEAIVFDDGKVMRLDEVSGTIKAFDGPGAFASTIFYFSDGVTPPDWAENCVAASLSRVRAQSDKPGSQPRAASLRVSALLYCDRVTWPRFDLDVLRYWGVGCLLDPEDGDALILEPELLRPLNRAARRSIKKKQLRSSVW